MMDALKEAFEEYEALCGQMEEYEEWPEAHEAAERMDKLLEVGTPVAYMVEEDWREDGRGWIAWDKPVVDLEEAEHEASRPLRVAYELYARPVDQTLRDHLENFWCWATGNDGAAIAEAPGLVDAYLAEQGEVG